MTHVETIFDRSVGYFGPRVKTIVYYCNNLGVLMWGVSQMFHSPNPIHWLPFNDRPFMAILKVYRWLGVTQWCSRNMKTDQSVCLLLPCWEPVSRAW